MLIGAVCTLLSAAGLGAALMVARRRRFALALRVAAVALLPVGLAMTGVVRFVLNMTFNPVAWAGVGVLGCAALLFLAGRLAERRGAGGGRSGRDTPDAPRSLPGAARRGGEADDFADIEAILKKHGI
ncbi:hypothetical protein [Streptomyces specialis]|uniref:hypothetical protein n=1 Tax=Streptomyces specialis TaxID=498367 RepID=UPI00073E8C80|nr:hypothetical protein [Streptomyces specialis]